MLFNANGIKYFKATNEKGISFDKGDSDKKAGDESYSLDFTQWDTLAGFVGY